MILILPDSYFHLLGKESIVIEQISNFEFSTWKPFWEDAHSDRGSPQPFISLAYLELQKLAEVDLNEK